MLFSISAAKIEIWILWNCYALRALAGIMSHVSAFNWANWFHLPPIICLCARIARPRDWKVFENVKPVSSCYGIAQWMKWLNDFWLFAAFPQMCVTAIANMQQAATKDGKSKVIFAKDDDIIPYIEHYWEAMTTMPRRVTQSWYATNIFNCMIAM